jgi:hypothetical protein
MNNLVSIRYEAQTALIEAIQSLESTKVLLDENYHALTLAYIQMAIDNARESGHDASIMDASC